MGLKGPIRSALDLELEMLRKTQPGERADEVGVCRAARWSAAHKSACVKICIGRRSWKSSVARIQCPGSPSGQPSGGHVKGRRLHTPSRTVLLHRESTHHRIASCLIEG